MQRVYLVTLAKETANPLAPKSDEVGKAAEKREKEKAKQAEEKKPEASPGEKKAEEKPKKPVVVKVDPDGIQNRIVGLEITPGNYRSIRMSRSGRIPLADNSPWLAGWRLRSISCARFTSLKQKSIILARSAAMMANRCSILVFSIICATCN